MRDQSKIRDRNSIVIKNAKRVLSLHFRGNGKAPILKGKPNKEAFNAAAECTYLNVPKSNHDNFIIWKNKIMLLKGNDVHCSGMVGPHGRSNPLERRERGSPEDDWRKVKGVMLLLFSLLMSVGECVLREERDREKR
ncbi:hypothetical protein TSUD_306980 [Trifolium subterraneum]|uniref:Uncharacterized protein n=1 Tax=Trifolium subterraneum TaxID=3900 RepID=A0A2Z6P0L8_TRISU|nr:hypothetical protein TSUD_306980 [Trifolium subterraneum]